MRFQFAVFAMNIWLLNKKTLIPVEIPTRPWSNLAIGLFVFNGKNYVILVDYYSDYWQLTELHHTSATEVINFCKEQFSRHGICDILLSDNASQFSSAEFSSLAVELEFQHSTSSPYHSQSNGKTESAVKIAKRLLTKAFRDGSDPFNCNFGMEKYAKRTEQQSSSTFDVKAHENATSYASTPSTSASSTGRGQR